MCYYSVLVQLLVVLVDVCGGFDIRSSSSHPDMEQSPETGRLRATRRMSVVDYWSNETHGDGLNVTIAHHVNSWPALLDQLRDPFLNKSLIIEGDVFLFSHRKHRHRAIPIMSMPARHTDRITFKEWLREVGNFRKAIKINFRSTEVVKPALQYLYAAQQYLQSPVILHANIFRSPFSYEEPVNGHVFIDESTHYFPDASVSIGWTRVSTDSVKLTTNASDQYRISWRQVFDILEYTYDLHQPLIISVRLSVASRSTAQLLWLLDTRTTISLLIWSDEEDKTNNIDQWNDLIALRQFAAINRVIYDLTSEHRQMLMNARIQSTNMKQHIFNGHTNWRIVEFINPTAMLSTIFDNDRGIAFLGWPTSFIIAEISTNINIRRQSISGHVLFIPKPSFVDINPVAHTGLSIYLIDKVLVDIPSPIINIGIWAFIGYDGKIFIENRDISTSTSRIGHHQRIAIAQMSPNACYSFTLIETSWYIELIVWTDDRECETGHIQNNNNRTSNIIGRTRRRSLRLKTTPPTTGRLRHVLVQKSGDGAIDCLLENLEHNAATKSIVRSIAVIIMLSIISYLSMTHI